MKKTFIIAQFILLFVLCGGIFWSAFKPAPKPDYNTAEWSSWKGFFVLSYQGISKKDGADHVSAKQLGKQLGALKKAGFHTITPNDAAAFLEGKVPLPQKAILLLFEGGRKDSLVYATPHLRKNGFFGVMCVPTKLLDLPGTFYLNRKDLGKLGEQTNWRLCSMGNRAIDTISIDAQGTKGHFLTDFMWTAQGLEDRTSFSERVNRDYEEASSTLKKTTGARIEAYLYPFSDTGTREGVRSVSARVNLESLKKFHRIAFTRADNAFNARQSNPYDLNRLRVPAGWDAARLLSELGKYGPRETAVNGTPNQEEFITKGDVKVSSQGVQVGADSLAWLRGTDDWNNLDIKARVALARDATAFLYGRYKSTQSYLRLSMSSEGLRLQERVGNQTQTLAFYPVAIGTTQEHTIGLRIRGNRAWAHLDDKLIAGPVPLTTETNKGRIGLGSVGGPSQFTRLSAGRIPSYCVALDDFQALPQAVKDETAAILQIWFKDSVNPSITGPRIKDTLVAASQGIVTVPVVEVPSGFSRARAESFADGIVKALSNPLVKPLIKHIAVKSCDDTVPSLLRPKGYKIIRIVSAGRNGESSLDTGKLHTDDMVLIEGAGKDVQNVLRVLLHSIPEDRVLVPIDKKTGKHPDAGVAVYSGHI
ncbi:MAG: hypothetical protein A4E63_03047 [Syntrophorhabdus sp. PtaU1.Bin050]|nr:MAG: hypothetical protein A4E63_03047 [Syntrophorhabdus sp. PtaU1.Bin050]